MLKDLCFGEGVNHGSFGSTTLFHYLTCLNISLDSYTKSQSNFQQRDKATSRPQTLSMFGMIASSLMHLVVLRFRRL
ncbi:hypothetical protein HanIR_Chr13g0655541 [Helianthus annuus]|nr:hypothetical protein HanIR_Chr13g0655541 [Helianthus annuus]